MKITNVALHPVVVERSYGTVIAEEGGKPKRTVTKSYFFFLEFRTDNGLTGWGEVSDIVPEDLPKKCDDYRMTLSDLLVGRDPFDLQKIHHDLREHLNVKDSSLDRYTSCAIDMAMYDLQGKAVKRPVYQLLGGKVRKDVRISWVAYIREDLDLIRDEVKEKVKQGFTAFKLKVGVDIELDEKRVALVREIAGKDASIKVDANEGWSLRDAAKNIRRLHKYNLAGVETPVPREKPRDIAMVRKQVDVPIIEHVNDLEYGLALIEADAVDVFNVATTGAGGIWHARRIVTLAESAKLGVLLGSTVELGPGTLAQLHFAVTVPNLVLPSDLIGPGLYRQDVLRTPLKYEKGTLRAPTTAGLGGEVDKAKLKKLTF